VAHVRPIILRSLPSVEIPSLKSQLLCNFNDLQRTLITKGKIETLDLDKAQIELLKIDWGQPGLCTEWDRDYDPKTRSCGRRGKLIERGLAK